ncbi:MAG TPA: PAS domain-containing protein [Bryobacteraceae bacterium]|nr:PAS domain-containing protein [Bryobacteraceae bacterium]
MSDLAPCGPNRENNTDNSTAGSQSHVLQFVLDSMRDGVTIMDRQATFVLRNRAAEHIAGIAPKHTSPIDWSRDLGVCLPKGAASLSEEDLPMLRALRGETVDSVELFVCHPHAPQGRWVSVTARPLADEQGIPNGAIAIYRDVTERKQVEQALSASEGRYRLLFEKNLAGVLRTALDGRVLECNEAFAKMLGYDTSEEVASLNVEAFYCQPAERDAILGRLREQKALTQEEICFRRKDGAPAWILTNLNLVEDEAGGATIIGTSFDITERKISREALKQSQQRFAAFMRHLPGVAFMKNREGHYVYYNEAAQGLFQLDPQDFLGKTDHDVWPVEYADRFVSNDRQVILTKALVETVDPVPHKHAVHYWLIYRFPILDEHDEVQFIGGVGVDITERRQLEDQLRQSQKMEAIGRLAGGVAHDFNNLLTVISGYGHMIIRDLPHDDPLHSCVEEVLKAASRATSLTNQLLAFSRRQVIQPKVLDLNALVANMDRMLRRVIGEHIELETVLSPGIGSVKADAGQLEQVIMNLAVNARDAMSEGGRLSIRTSNVEVRRSSRVHTDVRPGSYVKLTVADTGKGMDAEIMVHLFEPFYTSKETGKGTGLGLSTVYGIVKQSGGEIVVESEPGRGAIFNIYLPRITDPTQLAPSTAGERPVRAGTETILLVEDELGVRQLVHEMLRRLGYTIYEASNGADAVRIFAQHQNAIDLLLTDVIMPQMSGRELAERLKAVRPTLKVLYISGYTDDMLAHHGVLESNVYLLQKPFAPDDLAKKLREVLDTPTVRRADA